MVPAGNEALTRRLGQIRGLGEAPRLTIDRLQACPFCERVVRTVNERGLEYRSRFVEATLSDRDAVEGIIERC